MSQEACPPLSRNIWLLTLPTLPNIVPYKGFPSSQEIYSLSLFLKNKFSRERSSDHSHLTGSYISSEKLGEVCLEEEKRAILDLGVLPLEEAPGGTMGGGGWESRQAVQPFLGTQMALGENGNPDPKGVSTASPQAGRFANWQ